jgi:predicted DNA-binding transcriptional regulator YafY
MRADRLLSILLLLQVRQRVTARELARRLEVSTRTIYRDMDALSGAGIPVFAERGADGGWSLVEAYRTDLTGLNTAEIAALFLQPSGLLADLGLDKASTTALVKLLAALPSMQRHNAEHVRRRIHVDGASWFDSQEDVSALPVLQEGVFEERKIWLSYERSDGKAVERVVNPLGLVAKGRVWYLVATVEGDMRTYRVSRVQAAETMDEAAARPEGFDLATHWEESVARFRADLPRYPAVVRVTAGAVARLRRLRFTRVQDVGPPDADGWATVSVQFETLEDASEAVLGLGPRIEVLEPPELRQRVMELAQEIVLLYH